MTTLDELLDAAIEVLAEVGADYAVIGGCARNAYAPERATRDVDLAVTADPAVFQRLLAAMGQRGFQVATSVNEDPSDAVPDLTLFQRAGGRIDVLFAKTPFEHSALGRRVQMALAGRSLPVVTVEDLIVYKLAAGRPQDLADVDDVARTQAQGGRVIDWAYVEKWCDEWEVGDRLRALRKQLEG